MKLHPVLQYLQEHHCDRLKFSPRELKKCSQFDDLTKLMKNLEDPKVFELRATTIELN